MYISVYECYIYACNQYVHIYTRIYTYIYVYIYILSIGKARNTFGAKEKENLEDV